MLPNHAPLGIGPVTNLPTLQSGDLSALAYPSDASVVSATTISVQAGGCGRRSPSTGQAQLRSLSLFGGTVVADYVALKLTGPAATQADTVNGLEVDHRATSANAGATIRLHDWGYLTIGTRQLVPSNNGSADTRSTLLRAAALTIDLLQPHDGLPAGTVLLVSFAEVPAPPAPTQRISAHQRQHARNKQGTRDRGRARRPHHKRPASRPLKITPSLGLTGYIFPVAGPDTYGDSYGAFRGDVSGNWHHGDDIFAPLGTPIVAVATGTLSDVGWEPIGGWRVWLRDGLGNEFYYAHLSGFAPIALHSSQIRIGQVIGFVGNTGDAFTTSAHLHFEIHPHTLLSLGYDGAVDPTNYLSTWSHIERLRSPHPVHPRFPAGPVHKEATYVFRELLAARHLIRHAPTLSGKPDIRPSGGDIDAPQEPAPAAAKSVPLHSSQPHASSQPTATVLGIAFLALIPTAALGLLLRRRASPTAKASAPAAANPEPPPPPVGPASPATSPGPVDTHPTSQPEAGATTTLENAGNRAEPSTAAPIAIALLLLTGVAGLLRHHRSRGVR
jgi:murein DD-endopeptidase MepM/ murein hydrolase activator NlpD